MHGKNLKKTQGFINFFNSNEDGSLTKQTKLLRDTVRFFISNDFGVYFKSRMLTRWLLKNNDEFIDDYASVYSSRTNISNRIENRLDRVTKCLNLLIEMELLWARKTKAAKGDTSTSEYALNGLGYLIGLFLETIDRVKNSPVIYEKLFQLFTLMFSDEQTSMDKFSMIYFTNLQERGLFVEHIDSIKQFFFLSHLSWHDAIKYMICLPLSSDESGKQRWEVWKYSLEQLEILTKGLFLYQLKLYFDRMMERHVKSFSNYELARINVAKLENLRQIVVEMECRKCKLYYMAYVDILAYLDSIYTKSDMPHQQYKEGKFIKSNLKCSNCNMILEFEKLII